MILECTRFQGRKYVVERVGDRIYLKINGSPATQSVHCVGATGLYYDEVAELLPRGSRSRICLLGLAGGSICRRYREMGGAGFVVGVDPDREMVRLGMKWFSVDRYVDEIYLQSANRFISESYDRNLLPFDVVIDDVWINSSQKVRSINPASILKNDGYILRWDGEKVLRILL